MTEHSLSTEPESSIPGTSLPPSPLSSHTCTQATPTESSKPQLQKKATVKVSAGQGQRRFPTPSARVQHLHRQGGLMGSKWSPGVLAHWLYNHQLWLYMNELMTMAKPSAEWFNSGGDANRIRENMRTGHTSNKGIKICYLFCLELVGFFNHISVRRFCPSICMNTLRQ